MGDYFNYATVCALSNEYDANVESRPGSFLPYLYKDNGTNGYSRTAKLQKDLTNSFNDISIVKFKLNYNGVINYD